MKTIGVSKQLRRYISEVSYKWENVDTTVNRLMDNMSKPVSVGVSGRTNISISEDTYSRLEEYRLYDTEPIVSVVLRLVCSGFDDLIHVVVRVNGVDMDCFEFKDKFLDQNDIVFSDDYQVFSICDSFGRRIVDLSMDYACREDKDNFVGWVKGLGY